MTLLNFPANPALVNNIYVGPNGVRYIFDGVKWVGQSAGGGGISTELVNGVHNVAITPSGTIEFPYFTFPASDGANGQVLKTNGSGVLSWTSDSTTTYRLYNTNLTYPAQHYTLEVYTNGVVVLPDRSIINGSTLRGIYGTGDANFTGITIGPNAGHQEESWVWVDKDGAHVGTRYSGGISAAKQWDFDNSGDLIIPDGGHIKHQDGSPYSAAATNTGNFTFIGSNIEMPDSARLNSGGIGNDGASDFGTDVSYESGDDANPIVSSEIFMGSGYGEFRSIYNKVGATESGLTYGGVEGFNYASYGDVNFSGMVSQTPNIDSMYTVGINGDDQIVIGFTQNGQTSVSDDWSVTVGTLNTGYTVSGMFADTAKTVMSGGTGNNSSIKLIDNEISLSVRDRKLIITSPIQLPTPDDIHIYAEDDDLGVTVGNSDMGSYVTVNGLNNNQTVEIVTQTGGRNPNNSQWYNILANVTAGTPESSYNSTVLYDSQGNVYTIGGYQDVNNNNSTDNLYQKFDSQGNRLWKKTWSLDGIFCGTFNQSARMVLAGNYGYTEDTIFWTSYSPNGSSYVGRMDTDGRFNDGAGNPTRPIRIDNYNTYVSDLEPTTDGYVYVAGHTNDNGSNYPFIAKLDLNSSSQSVTNAKRISYPDTMDTNDNYNMFKTIAQDATFDGLFTAGFYRNVQSLYYDAIFSAWRDYGSGPEHIASYQVGANDSTLYDIILETIAVNNNAAYAVANYNNAAAVIKVTQTGPNTYRQQWQTKIGGGSHSVVGTGLAFDSDNNVYLMLDGQGEGIELTKIRNSDGTVLWSRLITSGFMNDGIRFDNTPTRTTSNDIQIRGNLAVLTGYTYDKSERSGCFTIQYNIVTHPVGTYGDFTISNIDLGYASDDLSITPLDVFVEDFTLEASNEAMISTVVTATEGWESTHWDIVSNQEVIDSIPLVTNTWTYGTDGSLTLPSAGKIINNNNIWTFSNVGDLAVPGQIKNGLGHRAVWSNEVPRDVSDLTDNQMLLGMSSSTIDINIDGGGAYATYEGTLVRADGGFSSVRWGINSVIYDGGSGAGGTYTNSLNGGGA